MASNPTQPPTSAGPADVVVPDEAEDEIQIEPDDIAALETDSAFDDNASDVSSKESLMSGVAKYRIENGRSYHAYKEGKYLLPNDEVEQERLDLQHHVFNLAFDGKLFEAPLKNPNRVLDAGTGTGIWAIDFADQFPSAHVIGSDLSPIQPGWVPPNLEFEIDDIEDSWQYSRPFDYIHIRVLAGSIKDYPRLIAQAFENLSPGGYLEVVEFEVWCRDQKADPEGSEPRKELKSAPMIQTWQSLLHEAGDKIGRTFDISFHLKNWLTEVGFEDVTERKMKIPETPWPKSQLLKQIGAYQQQNMLDASSSYGSAHFTRVLGWSSDEFEILSAQVRNEFKNKNLQLYANLFVVYGRKPEEPTSV